MGVVEPLEDNRIVIESTYGVKTFANIGEVYKLGLEVLLASIATPPETHFEIAMTLIDNGTNIIIEKPIFTNIEEAKLAKEAADKKNVSIIAVHNLLFSGLRSLLMNKERLGVIRKIELYWMNQGKLNHMTSDPDHWSHRLFGGRWEELIPHMIYVTYRFVGEFKVISVEVMQNRDDLQWVKGSDVNVLIRFKNGFGSFDMSSSNDYNFYRFIGDKESVSYGGKFLNYSPDKSPLEKLLNNPYKFFSPLLDKIIQKMFYLSRIRRVRSPHEVLFNETIEAIVTKKEMPVVWDEALFTLSVTCEIGAMINQQYNNTLANKI